MMPVPDGTKPSPKPLPEPLMSNLYLVWLLAGPVEICHIYHPCCLWSVTLYAFHKISKSDVLANYWNSNVDLILWMCFLVWVLRNHFWLEFLWLRSTKLSDWFHSVCPYICKLNHIFSITFLHIPRIQWNFATYVTMLPRCVTLFILHEILKSLSVCLLVYMSTEYHLWYITTWILDRSTWNLLYTSPTMLKFWERFEISVMVQPWFFIYPSIHPSPPSIHLSFHTQILTLSCTHVHRYKITNH